eukprot:7911273-Lingulodinium_polyedra.AAC.1
MSLTSQGKRARRSHAPDEGEAAEGVDVIEDDGHVEGNAGAPYVEDSVVVVVKGGRPGRRASAEPQECAQVASALSNNEVL